MYLLTYILIFLFLKHGSASGGFAVTPEYFFKETHVSAVAPCPVVGKTVIKKADYIPSPESGDWKQGSRKSP